MPPSRVLATVFANVAQRRGAVAFASGVSRRAPVPEDPTVHHDDGEGEMVIMTSKAGNSATTEARIAMIDSECEPW